MFKKILLLLIFSSSLSVSARIASAISYNDFPDYNTVKEFSENQNPSAKSITKVEEVLDTVFWANEGRHAHQIKINQELKKQYITVTQWNIERGYNLALIKQIFSNPDQYLKSQIKNLNPEDLAELKSQIQILKNSDIFIINEADWGVPRTNFKNITGELARIIKAEYVFIPEFLELNPELIKDHKSYRGLHGNAIISKYPIKNPRVLKLPLVYDWYTEELEKKSPLEALRRVSSKVTVKEEILTEVRQGARVALIADITLPNKQNITVVNAHLENRAEAKERKQQMRSILKSIKEVKNPLILAGDLNNFEQSAEATSVRKLLGEKISDPLFISRIAISYFNPYGLAANIANSTISLARKHRDPTVPGIPILSPNKTRGIFNAVEDFKFSDNNQFDFSGNKELSYKHKAGKLGNSNQRGYKGFIETFKFKRSFGIAKYKIDWIFVKPLRKELCRDKDFEDLGYQCKEYFPAFAKTLKELNFSPKDLSSISDHSPVSVQIMF